MNLTFLFTKSSHGIKKNSLEKDPKDDQLPSGNPIWIAQMIHTPTF